MLRWLKLLFRARASTVFQAEPPIVEFTSPSACEVTFSAFAECALQVTTHTTVTTRFTDGKDLASQATLCPGMWRVIYCKSKNGEQVRYVREA